jgi:SAM-dependent methyltransferase
MMMCWPCWTVFYRNRRGLTGTPFYTDRNRKVPFFADMPDENLVEYITKGILRNGKVLEVGCGPGRNAFYLAGKGFKVDAVDSSEEAISWAKERAEGKGMNINFIKEDIFLLKHEENDYGFVYDSGCFHHIPPHRRNNYLTLIERALKPGGYFALTTFIEQGPLGGAAISDWDVYRLGSMQGSLGYSEEKLKAIFGRYAPVEIRLMKDIPAEKGFLV